MKNWCLANKLIINFSKTLQIVFKNHQKNITLQDYQIENIATGTSTKFLGIVLDHHLTFSPHIEKLISTLNLLIMMFRHLTKFLDVNTMINLYYTFLYPHLLYGLEFWGSASSSHLNRVLVCQKKALRVIYKCPPNSSVSHKFKESKIMPISMLYKYRFVIFMFNLYKRDPILDSLKLDHNINTRNNSNQLKLPVIKTDKGRRSIFYSGSQLYGTYALDLTDLPTKSFRAALAARLWESA